jgi:serine/threonine protein kinase
MLFVTCQISGALSYLESRQLIHRDISTRNCLVFSDYMIKLTDIAMASPIYSHYYSTDAHLPVRWMSPEMLMVCFLFSNIFVFFDFVNRMVEMVIQLNLMFIVLV